MAPEPLNRMSDKDLESHLKEASSLRKKRQAEQMKKAIDAVDKLLKENFKGVTLQKIIEHKQQEAFVAAVNAAGEN